MGNELTENDFSIKICHDGRNSCFMEMAGQNRCDSEVYNTNRYVNTCTCKLMSLVNLYIKDHKVKQSPNVVKMGYPIGDLSSSNSAKREDYYIHFVYNDNSVTILEAYIRKH